MSITASMLVAEIAVKGAQEASALLGEVGASSEGASSKLKSLTLGGLAIAGAALVAVGVESTKMAADFQTAMLSNVAHAGLAKNQIDSVSQSVLAMSTEVGRSPTQLAEALYPILSAFSGIQNQSAKSAIALDTLKMSFETVAGTTVDGTAVANAAVGTFNALGLATNNVSENTARMTNLFDVMDKTVQLGNMQWDAYKNVVSKLAVAIQGTGISFNESQAALAEMTNEGFSAQKASTYLANTFTTLEIKTDSLAKHAKSMGIAFNEQKFKSMDLAGQIEYLNQVTDGNKSKLLALMNNNSTALKTFDALSIGISGYKSNLDSLNHAQGALKASFDEASKGFNFQMQQLKAAGDALMVTIGSQLLPLATRIVAAITPVITAFSNWITWMTQGSNALDWFNSHLQIIIPVIAGLAAAIGYALVTALWASVPAIWAVASGVIAATWPVLAIGAAIAGVAAILVYAYQHWQAFHDVVDSIIPALSSVWNWIENNIIPAFSRMWNWLQNNLVPALASAWNWIENNVVPALSSMWNWIANNVVFALSAMWNWTANSLVPALASMWNWIANSLIPALTSMWNWIENNVVPALSTAWNWIENSLVPALSDMWKWVEKNVVPALQGLWKIVGQVVTTLQDWYNKVMGVIDSIKQWNDKNDALNKGVGAVKDILGKVNDYINTQLIPTFNNIKAIITTQLIPAFQGIYKAVAPLVSNYLGVLKQAFGQIGQAIQSLGPYFDTLKKDFQEVGKMLQPFLPLLKTLASYWWIILIPLAAVVAEMGLFLLALGAVGVVLAKFVQGVATFVTGVVQVFSGFIQIASGYLQALDDLIHGHFDKLDKDTKIAGDGFKTLWQGAWNVIQGIWMASIGGIIAGAQWFVTTIFNLFVELYNKLVGHSIIPDMINAIVSWFASLPGKAISAVQGLVGKLTGFFGGIATQAFTWGTNIVQGVINGLLGKLANVGDAAHQIAQKIADFLPHSPAKEGPLSKLNEFGPALVKGFSQGIINSTPTLTAAITHMVQPASPGYSAPHYAFPSVLAASSSGSSSRQVIEIPLIIDGKEFARATTEHVGDHMARQTRLRYGGRRY